METIEYNVVMVDVGLFFLGVVFVAAPGVLLFKFAIDIFFEGMKKRKWKHAYGLIEESVLEPESSDSLAYPSIRYKFFIAEQPYWAQRDREGGSQSEIEKVVEKYKVGKRVEVYYDEADPENHSVILDEGEDVDELLKRVKFWQACAVLGALGLILSPFIGLGVCLLYYSLNPDPAWSPSAIDFFGES